MIGRPGGGAVSRGQSSISTQICDVDSYAALVYEGPADSVCASVGRDSVAGDVGLASPGQVDPVVVEAEAPDGQFDIAAEKGRAVQLDRGRGGIEADHPISPRLDGELRLEIERPALALLQAFP